MKMVKSLLLGIAAGIIACAAAQASDLPAKPAGMSASNPQHVMLPIKGDKPATIEHAFFIGHQRPTPLIVAEGAGLWAIPYEGVSTETGGSPACHLKPEYRVSYGAGVGEHDPFHGIDIDSGA